MLSRVGLVNEYSPLLLTAVTVPLILGVLPSVTMNQPRPRLSSLSAQQPRSIAGEAATTSMPGAVAVEVHSRVEDAVDVCGDADIRVAEVPHDRRARP